MPISVNMFGRSRAAPRHPRTQNGHAAYATTGSVSASCAHWAARGERSPCIGRPGIRSSTIQTSIGSASAAPATALLLGGCVNVPKDAGFSDVSAASKDRTGYAVAWTRGATEDAAADSLTRVLLVDPLTVDRAVQVAMLNNRTLQANFETLGIARGQLINASLFANLVIGFDVWSFGGGTTIEALLSEDLTSILYQPPRVGLYGGEFEATERLVPSGW